MSSITGRAKIRAPTGKQSNRPETEAGAASMKREDRLADFRISIMHPVQIFCENGWMYVPKGVRKNISIGYEDEHKIYGTAEEMTDIETNSLTAVFLEREKDER